MELKITYTDSFTGAQRTQTIPVPWLTSSTTGTTSEMIEYSLVMGETEYPLTLGAPNPPPQPLRLPNRFSAEP